jgi:hypothetical protein
MKRRHRHVLRSDDSEYDDDDSGDGLSDQWLLDIFRLARRTGLSLDRDLAVRNSGLWIRLRTIFEDVSFWEKRFPDPMSDRCEIWPRKHSTLRIDKCSIKLLVDAAQEVQQAPWAQDLYPLLNLLLPWLREWQDGSPRHISPGVKAGCINTIVADPLLALELVSHIAPHVLLLTGLRARLLSVRCLCQPEFDGALKAWLAELQTVIRLVLPLPPVLVACVETYALDARALVVRGQRKKRPKPKVKVKRRT